MNFTTSCGHSVEVFLVVVSGEIRSSYLRNSKFGILARARPLNKFPGLSGTFFETAHTSTKTSGVLAPFDWGTIDVEWGPHKVLPASRNRSRTKKKNAQRVDIDSSCVLWSFPLIKRFICNAVSFLVRV